MTKTYKYDSSILDKASITVTILTASISLLTSILISNQNESFLVENLLAVIVLLSITLIIIAQKKHKLESYAITIRGTKLIYKNSKHKNPTELEKEDIQLAEATTSHYYILTAQKQLKIHRAFLTNEDRQELELFLGIINERPYDKQH